MSIWATIGKWILKGGKFALDHSEEIGTAVEVATAVAGGFHNQQNEEPEEVLYEAEQEDSVDNKFIELRKDIASTMEAFAEHINTLNTQLEQDISNLNAQMEQNVSKLNAQLEEVRVAQEKHQESIQKNFMRLAICSGLGIVIAIVLAIFL